MIAIVQARLNSTRLPNKVLFKIKNKTINKIIYKRLKKSRTLKDIIFTIPDDKKNKKLEKLLKNLKIKYFKGSNSNVLKRYYQTATNFGVKNIVRVTSDCPLIDSVILDKMVKIFKKKKVDYISNNNPPSFPHGTDLEIFKYEVLNKAFHNAKSKRDKEHVTYYITRNKRKFKIKNFKNNKNLSKIRITLDYLNDYKVIKAVFDYFYPNIYFGINEISKLYKSNPKIFK
mgnify:CR=1 FL=1